MTKLFAKSTQIMLTEAKKEAFLTALRQQMEAAYDVLADQVEKVRHGSEPAYATDTATPPPLTALPPQNPE